MNPSIQHFTILNKDSDNSLENSQEKGTTKENPKIKLLNEDKDEKMENEKDIDEENIKNTLIPSRHGTIYYIIINLDPEFLLENRNLLKIDLEKTNLKNERKDTSMKSQKNPINIPIQNDKKNKRRPGRPFGTTKKTVSSS